MRLLNTYTLLFEQFFDEQILGPDRPRYLILSHRWRDGECTFQSFPELKYHWYMTPGFEKVTNFCRLAWLAGYPYVWCDTCCIDKTSSAELHEAINSMYRWYENSSACCVYLDDVGSDVGMETPVDVSSQSFNWNGIGDYRGQAQAIPSLSDRVVTSIKSSEWFKRGWTLQELLAPSHVRFFDKGWRYLGLRDGVMTMSKLISSITNIREDYLRDPSRCGSVAEKMSWASSRKTSRIEDRAYSMLGLFGISMPLIYGEGPKAFQRLQKEIINEIDDESIFAWWSEHNDGSILASSPDDFRFSAGVYPVGKIQRPPGTITSRGLKLEVGKKETMQRPFLLRLNCRHPDHSGVYIEICKQDQNQVGLHFRASFVTRYKVAADDEKVSDQREEHIPVYLALDQRTLRHNTAVLRATLELSSVTDTQLSRKRNKEDTTSDYPRKRLRPEVDLSSREQRLMQPAASKAAEVIPRPHLGTTGPTDHRLRHYHSFPLLG